MAEQQYGRFQVTVPAVVKFVPGVRLDVTEGMAGGIPTGRDAKVITTGQVAEWIGETSDTVFFRCPRAAQLARHADDFTAAARALVPIGTAAHVYAAAAPNHAQNQAADYTSVLWSRFTSGIDALAASLDGWLAEEADEDANALGAGAGSFPEPAFPDRMEF